MVTHNRVGTHINGKYFGQLEDLGSDPVPPMGEIPCGQQIDPTKKLTPHAAGDDVVVRGGVQRDELAAGHGHGGLTEFGLEIQASGRGALGL